MADEKNRISHNKNFIPVSWSYTVDGKPVGKKHKHSEAPLPAELLGVLSTAQSLEFLHGLSKCNGNEKALIEYVVSSDAPENVITTILKALSKIKTESDLVTGELKFSDKKSEEVYNAYSKIGLSPVVAKKCLQAHTKARFTEKSLELVEGSKTADVEELIKIVDVELLELTEMEDADSLEAQAFLISLTSSSIDAMQKRYEEKCKEGVAKG